MSAIIGIGLIFVSVILIFALLGSRERFKTAKFVERNQGDSLAMITPEMAAVAAEVHEMGGADFAIKVRMIFYVGAVGLFLVGICLIA